MPARDEKLNVGTTEPKTAEQLQIEVDELEEQIASLKLQVQLPLTGLEVMQLRTILADQKAKLGDHDAIIAGMDLLAKLDGYLNPQLPFGPKEFGPKEE